MFIAKDIHNYLLDINEATKGEIYFCPNCNNKLILKTGDINAHHFAHQKKSDCDDPWSEMSEWHLNWQREFPIECREAKLEHHRADVKLNNTIIEFQKSPLSSSEWIVRMDFYSANNNLIFLVDLRDKYIRAKKSYYYNLELMSEYYWPTPSRSIPKNFRYKMELFYQIDEDKILWINDKEKLYSWKEFSVKSILTKSEFLDIVNQISMDIKFNFEDFLFLNSSSYHLNNTDLIMREKIHAQLIKTLDLKKAKIINDYKSIEPIDYSSLEDEVISLQRKYRHALDNKTTNYSNKNNIELNKYTKDLIEQFNHTKKSLTSKWININAKKNCLDNFIENYYYQHKDTFDKIIN